MQWPETLIMSIITRLQTQFSGFKTKYAPKMVWKYYAATWEHLFNA